MATHTNSFRVDAGIACLNAAHASCSRVAIKRFARPLLTVVAPCVAPDGKHSPTFNYLMIRHVSSFDSYHVLTNFHIDKSRVVPHFNMKTNDVFKRLLHRERYWTHLYSDYHFGSSNDKRVAERSKVRANFGPADLG